MAPPNNSLSVAILASHGMTPEANESIYLASYYVTVHDISSDLNILKLVE